MKTAAEIVQQVLMYACLAGLGVTLAALFLRSVCGPVWCALRRLASLDLIQFALVMVIVCGFVHYGATKGSGGEYRPSIQWDTGLVDDGTQIGEDDTVDFRWQLAGIPASSTVYIDYRARGSRDEWQNLGEVRADALRFTGHLANARAQQYFVYSTYMPPPPVHTNGVWVGKAYKAQGDNKGFVVTQSRITVDGKTIATPEQVRRAEEDK